MSLVNIWEELNLCNKSSYFKYDVYLLFYITSVEEYFYYYSFVIIYFSIPPFCSLKNEIQGNIWKKDVTAFFRDVRILNVIIHNVET